ncbi:MAG: tetratricopeptide repeat protein [Thermodesulfobacteriota bacterium]
MAKRKPRRRAPQEPEEILGLAQQTLDKYRPYLKWLIVGGVVLALGIVGWFATGYLTQSREARAQAALEELRPQVSQPEQTDAAIQGLDGLIQKYPSTQAALVGRLYKAHLLYQTEKYADAAKTYKELRAALGNQDPYGWLPFITESLSYCYETQGDYAQAAQTLEPLANRTQGNYQIMLLSRLAVLYDKAGNRAEADAARQRLLTLVKDPALASYWKEKLAGSVSQAPPAAKKPKD